MHECGVVLDEVDVEREWNEWKKEIHDRQWNAFVSDELSLVQLPLHCAAFRPKWRRRCLVWPLQNAWSDSIDDAIHGVRCGAHLLDSWTDRMRGPAGHLGR